MVTTAQVDDNLAAAARLIDSAATQGADLVLLPEVFAVLEGSAEGKGNDPMREHAEVEADPSGKLQNFLSAQAKTHNIYLIGGTIPLASRPGKAATDPDYLVDNNRVRASSLVYDRNGKQLARYDKIHLFDVKVDDKQGQYSESRSYEPGTDLVCLNTELGKLGLSVCYDMRFPEFYRQLFLAGAQLITVPAAFTAVTGSAHWESLLRARAIENQCYVIAAAQGGRHNEKRQTWGHSMIIDPWGTILSELETGEGVAIAEINLNWLNEVRTRIPIADHIRLHDQQ